MKSFGGTGAPNDATARGYFRRLLAVTLKWLAAAGSHGREVSEEQYGTRLTAVKSPDREHSDQPGRLGLAAIP